MNKGCFIKLEILDRGIFDSAEKRLSPAEPLDGNAVAVERAFESAVVIADGYPTHVRDIKLSDPISDRNMLALIRHSDIAHRGRKHNKIINRRNNIRILGRTRALSEHGILAVDRKRTGEFLISRSIADVRNGYIDHIDKGVGHRYRLVTTDTAAPGNGAHNRPGLLAQIEVFNQKRNVIDSAFLKHALFAAVLHEHADQAAESKLIHYGRTHGILMGGVAMNLRSRDRAFDH